MGQFALGVGQSDVFEQHRFSRPGRADDHQPFALSHGLVSVNQFAVAAPGHFERRVDLFHFQRTIQAKGYLDLPVLPDQLPAIAFQRNLPEGFIPGYAFVTRFGQPLEKSAEIVFDDILEDNQRKENRGHDPPRAGT